MNPSLPNPRPLTGGSLGGGTGFNERLLSVDVPVPTDQLDKDQRDKTERWRDRR